MPVHLFQMLGLLVRPLQLLWTPLHAFQLLGMPVQALGLRLMPAQDFAVLDLAVKTLLLAMAAWGADIPKTAVPGAGGKGVGCRPGSIARAGCARSAAGGSAAVVGGARGCAAWRPVVDGCAGLLTTGDGTCTHRSQGDHWFLMVQLMQAGSTLVQD